MTSDELLKKRCAELSLRARRAGIYTYTEFLTPAEQQDIGGVGDFVLLGGYPEAQRRIAVFGSADFPPNPPLECIKIAPVNPRFAGALSHRDYLGALMNLGIKREMLGDIIVSHETAYLFCIKSVAGYITESLERVGSTSVACCAGELPEDAAPKPQRESVNVPSARLDAVAAAVWHSSRGQIAAMISAGSVMLNYRECTDSSAKLRPGDTVSARGLGKFSYAGGERTTKKGRLFIDIDRYV